MSDYVCFFETGEIGAVWIRWIYFQSSAARRSVRICYGPLSIFSQKGHQCSTPGHLACNPKWIDFGFPTPSGTMHIIPISKFGVRRTRYRTSYSMIVR
eukprot:COSAG02_NODE_5833_length_4004_cov_2.279641_6_plen_98_part_00